MRVPMEMRPPLVSGFHEGPPNPLLILLNEDTAGAAQDGLEAKP